MHTVLADFIRETPAGQEAREIIGKCVHCGFCTATCPTYQLLGDELDSPRGRIYLIKHALESGECAAPTRTHLDRCLTCRSCETTCPSGVRYGRLLEIGREVVEEKAPRHLLERAVRWLLRRMMLGPLFAPMLGAARTVRAVLPHILARQVPPRRPTGDRPAPRHPRQVLMLEGCVQPAMDPAINAAACRVLDRIGLSVKNVPGTGCCGALSLHLGASEEARQAMRRNIDAWWPHVEAGIEAIVMTASGCGVTVREYAELLAEDDNYAEKARQISELTRDIAEVIHDGEHSSLQAPPGIRVAFHSPCSLQHGQAIRGKVEAILAAAGAELVPVVDSHLCCGSAGTYSLLQPALSGQLLDNKLGHLQQHEPQVIASANIGCLVHLAGEASVPVRHWVELLDPQASALLN